MDGSAETSAVLTEASTGKTYVYTGDDGSGNGTGKVEAAASEADKIAVVPVGIKVTYTPSGGDPMPGASELLQIWQRTIGNNNITINGSGTANVRFLSKSSGLAIADWEGTAGNAETPATSTVGNTALRGVTFTNGESSVAAGASFNIALTGQDIIEDESVTYTVTFTPVVPE